MLCVGHFPADMQLRQPAGRENFDAGAGQASREAWLTLPSMPARLLGELRDDVVAGAAASPARVWADRKCASSPQQEHRPRMMQSTHQLLCIITAGNNRVEVVALTSKPVIAAGQTSPHQISRQRHVLTIIMTRLAGPACLVVEQRTTFYPRVQKHLARPGQVRPVTVGRSMGC